jgi:hypothetical protein
VIPAVPILDVVIVDVPALKVRFVVVVASHIVPFAVLVSENVPLPILNVRVPVPVILIVCAVMLLLFTLKSTIHPVVDAVHAPIVIDVTFTVVLTVIVHVTPPTHVAASKVTVSPDPGTDAPVAPPLEADHIAVLDPSQVHAAVQTPKREAA